MIRSYHRHIFTEEVNKVTLSADEDKRIILEDSIHTLAYGHYKTQTNFKVFNINQRVNSQ